MKFSNRIEYSYNILSAWNMLNFYPFAVTRVKNYHFFHLKLTMISTYYE